MSGGTGRLTGIHVKSRTPGEFGLPKRAIEGVEIRATGLAYDFNNYRHEELSGDPDSAVLLLSEEVLAELRSEGWPVRPGDLGENLLLRGLDYNALAPLQELQVGEDVQLCTTRACEPCTRLAVLPYVGRERCAAFMRATLDRRGWYARVLRPGFVRVGDVVALPGELLAPRAAARGASTPAESSDPG